MLELDGGQAEPADLVWPTLALAALMAGATVLGAVRRNVGRYLGEAVARRTYQEFLGMAGGVSLRYFESAAFYDRPVLEVPLIRRKARSVLERAVRMPGGHNAKRLRNIVENYPRDELFQATEDELLQTALGILHLYDRPRARLFARRDALDRFISVLAFFPRDRYDSALRARRACSRAAVSDASSGARTCSALGREGVPARSGSNTVKVLPAPSVLSSVISPPSRRTRSRLIDRPRPVPP